MVKENIKSVIQRAVEAHKGSGRDEFVNEHKLELVVDTSPIVISELEAKLTEVAHNIGTDRENVLPWSADVGEALVLMDKTLMENERLTALLGMVTAHLEVAQNASDNKGYVDAALELCRLVPKKKATDGEVSG